MAVTAETMIQRCRRFLGDWPLQDVLTASLSSSGTSLTVADSSIYTANWHIQVDDELMRVRSTPSGTSVSVFRAHLGSTAASHASSASVLIQPRFANIEYLDALNAALDAAFPLLYQRVVDESIEASATTYEYALPTLNDVPIPYLSKVYVKDTGGLRFHEKRDWGVHRGSSPSLVFTRSEIGTVRLDGFGPFPSLGSSSSSLSAQFPANATDYLLEYMGQWLLSSGEARRVRQDVGMPDQRENAVRVGSSMTAANALYNRANQLLARVAMPPLPKNVKPTF